MGAGKWDQENRSSLLKDDDRQYFSVGELMTSPFMIGQLILNIVVSYAGVFFCFWLIFIHFGPDYYGCFSSQVLSPILISPFATPILALAWAPVGMLDAIDKGWFGFVRDDDLKDGIFGLLPYRSQYGVVRHIFMGCQLAVVAIPIMLLIVIFGIASDPSAEESSDGYPPEFADSSCLVTDWQQVVSCVTYIAILPLYVIPVGLLGFAKETNLERVYTILNGKNIIMKGIYSPLC